MGVLSRWPFRAPVYSAHDQGRAPTKIAAAMKNFQTAPVTAVAPRRVSPSPASVRAQATVAGRGWTAPVHRLRRRSRADRSTTVAPPAPGRAWMRPTRRWAAPRRAHRNRLATSHAGTARRASRRLGRLVARSCRELPRPQAVTRKRASHAVMPRVPETHRCRARRRTGACVRRPGACVRRPGASPRRDASAFTCPAPRPRRGCRTCASPRGRR